MVNKVGFDPGLLSVQCFDDVHNIRKEERCIRKEERYKIVFLLFLFFFVR